MQTNQIVRFEQAAFNFHTTAAAEGVLTPPASLPPIAQPLAATGRVSAAAQPQEGKIAFEGAVVLNVIYSCAEGKVHGFDSVAQFRHVSEAPGARAGMRVEVEAQLGEVNYTPSGDSLAVNAVIDLVCAAFSTTEVNVITTADAESRTAEFEAAVCAAQTDETNLREDVRLPRMASKLVSVSGCARVSSVSHEGARAIVEGTLRLTLLFIAPDGTLVQAPASLPFEGRMPLTAGGKVVKSDARVVTLSAALVDDDVVNVEAALELRLVVENRQTHTALVDAYATGSQLVLDSATLLLLDKHADSLKGSLRQQVKIPQGRPLADRVLAAPIWAFVEKAVATDGQLTLSGRLRGSVLYVCREGNLHAQDISLPFSTTLESSGLKAGMNTLVKLAVDMQHANAAGGEISLQLALEAQLDAWGEKRQSVVTRISEKERQNQYAGPCIYFLEPAETLWDVGKRFGVGLDEIRRLNPEATDGARCVLLNLQKRA